MTIYSFSQVKSQILDHKSSHFRHKTCIDPNMSETTSTKLWLFHHRSTLIHSRLVKLVHSRTYKFTWLNLCIDNVQVKLSRWSLGYMYIWFNTCFFCHVRDRRWVEKSFGASRPRSIAWSPMESITGAEHRETDGTPGEIDRDRPRQHSWTLWIQSYGVVPKLSFGTGPDVLAPR